MSLGFGQNGFDQFIDLTVIWPFHHITSSLNCTLEWFEISTCHLKFPNKKSTQKGGIQQNAISHTENQNAAKMSVFMFFHVVKLNWNKIVEVQSPSFYCFTWFRNWRDDMTESSNHSLLCISFSANQFGWHVVCFVIFFSSIGNFESHFLYISCINKRLAYSNNNWKNWIAPNI